MEKVTTSICEELKSFANNNNNNNGAINSSNIDPILPTKVNSNCSSEKDPGRIHEPVPPPPEVVENSGNCNCDDENFVPEVGREITVKTQNQNQVEKQNKCQTEHDHFSPEELLNDSLLFPEKVEDLEQRRSFNMTASSTSGKDCEVACSTNSRVNQLKCHNLSVSELRRKLSVCPVCQFQYSNYKLATLCLTKHGKRQCWLCLEVLSTKKDDYYRHCIQHHHISLTGDNVGCPYCPKYFDFRQGLNQHIVKIHFAENISDLYAVASLSPKTLVDIFTGQPRSSSSSKVAPVHCHDPDPEEEGALIIHEEDEEQASRSPSTIVEISYAAIIPPPPTPLPLHSHFHKIHRPASTPLKMSVPPEQTMKSLLQEEISMADSTPPSTFLDESSSHSQQQQIIQFTPNPYFDEERTIEVIDNSLKYHHPSHSSSDPSSFAYNNCYEDDTPQRSFGLPPSTQMSRVTCDPEKYEMSFYPDYSPKGKLPSGVLSSVTVTTPSPSSSSYGGGGDAPSMRSSYEKDIVHISSFDRIISYEEKADDDVGESNKFACLTEAEKSYLESITNMLETSSYNNDGSIVDGGKSNGGSSILPCAKEGYIFQPEIKGTGTYHPPSGEKFYSNCGVKRRILMKARWDEQNHHHHHRHHQFKKPAVPETLASLETTPSLSVPSSCSSSSPSNMDRERSLGRTYNDVDICFGMKPEDVPIRPPSMELHHQQRATIIVSQGQILKHAGPFFEQYVKQEGTQREDPYKLLNLAGSTRHPEGLINVGIPDSSSIAKVWNNTSGGGCLNPVTSSARHHHHPPSSSSCQWQGPVFPSPSYSQSRPQFPVPYHHHHHQQQQQQLPLRKGANPNFWDNLRARLLTQSSQRSAENRSRGRGSSSSSCWGMELPRLESVIVQNPFEEEALSQKKFRRISSSILDLKLGANQFNAPPELHPHPLHLPRGSNKKPHHPHPFHGLPVPASPPIPLLRNPNNSNGGALTTGQREFLSNPTSLFQPPPPTPPLLPPRYQLHQQHQQMMDQCRRISHGSSMRDLNPQRYNRYVGEFQQSSNRY